MPTKTESEKNTCPTADSQSSASANAERSGTKSAYSAVALLEYISPLTAITVSRNTGTITVNFAVPERESAPFFRQRNIIAQATIMQSKTIGENEFFKIPSKKNPPISALGIDVEFLQSGTTLMSIAIIQPSIPA